MLQVPEKGGKFGAKLTHRCGFWLDLPMKNIFRSHNWLEQDRTHLILKKGERVRGDF